MLGWFVLVKNELEIIYLPHEQLELSEIKTTYQITALDHQQPVVVKIIIIILLIQRYLYTYIAPSGTVMLIPERMTLVLLPRPTVYLSRRTSTAEQSLGGIDIRRLSFCI